MTRRDLTLPALTASLAPGKPSEDNVASVDKVKLNIAELIADDYSFYYFFFIPGFCVNVENAGISFSHFLLLRLVLIFLDFFSFLCVSNSFEH